MRKEIENWWKQAKRDLITAEHCKDSGDYYACAFFCQQSIEKGLKALFLLKNKTNPVNLIHLYIWPLKPKHLLYTIVFLES
jgi:HEPN domain-containing protein